MPIYGYILFLPAILFVAYFATALLMLVLWRLYLSASLVMLTLSNSSEQIFLKMHVDRQTIDRRNRLRALDQRLQLACPTRKQHRVLKTFGAASEDIDFYKDAVFTSARSCLDIHRAAATMHNVEYTS